MLLTALQNYKQILSLVLQKLRRVRLRIMKPAMGKTHLVQALFAEASDLNPYLAEREMMYTAAQTCALENGPMQS